MRIWRRVTQALFLGVTLAAVFVFASAAEQWCPFGGIEALYHYFGEGGMPCSLAVTNLYVLAAVLLVTLLLRRAFCGYVCPLGALGEWLHAVGRRAGVPRVEVSARGDRVLSLGKYLVCGVIVYFTFRTGELVFRGYDPCYALLSRHGEDITWWAYALSVALIVASLAIAVPLCRWLCPLAAVLNLCSRWGWARVRRRPEACASCGACAEACAMRIAIDTLEEVRAARCTACMECLDACAHKGRDALRWEGAWPRGRALPRGLVVGVLVAATAGAIAAATLAPLPAFVKARDSAHGALATLELHIEGVTCRGAANLLFGFLTRDDTAEVTGYLRLEAWPGAGGARVRITHDPAASTAQGIKEALTEPYYDAALGRYRDSPFRIEGFAPWEESGAR